MAPNGDERSAPDRFIYGLGAGVFAVWSISCIAQIVTGGDYQTPIAIHGMMGTIVGAVFAEARIRVRRRQLRDGE